MLNCFQQCFLPFFPTWLLFCGKHQYFSHSHAQSVRGLTRGLAVSRRQLGLFGLPRRSDREVAAPNRGMSRSLRVPRSLGESCEVLARHQPSSPARVGGEGGGGKWSLS